MKAIKRLFSNEVYFPPNQVKDEYLQQIRFNSVGQLMPQYQIILPSTLSRCQKPSQFLGQLIKELKNLTTTHSILKMLTLIHNFVVSRNYCQQDIKELSNMDLHLESKPQQAWFQQLYRSYVTYLIKLQQLSDVYVNITKTQYNVSPAVHLTHIFRITNTVTTLFPAITNAVNIIGRYRADKNIAIRQLYAILSGELVKVYSYMKYLCDQILRQYRVYNPKDLICFLKILPEIQLLCDKIEDLLVNKYIKGKKIVSKIQFKQERVAQVQYYLEYQYHSTSEKSPHSIVS